MGIEPTYTASAYHGFEVQEAHQNLTTPILKLRIYYISKQSLFKDRN